MVREWRYGVKRVIVDNRSGFDHIFAEPTLGDI